MSKLCSIWTEPLTNLARFNPRGITVDISTSLQLAFQGSPCGLMVSGCCAPKYHETCTRHIKQTRDHPRHLAGALGEPAPSRKNSAVGWPQLGVATRVSRTQSAMVQPRHENPAFMIARTLQPGKFMSGRHWLTHKMHHWFFAGLTISLCFSGLLYALFTIFFWHFRYATIIIHVNFCRLFLKYYSKKNCFYRFCFWTDY